MTWKTTLEYNSKWAIASSEQLYCAAWEANYYQSHRECIIITHNTWSAIHLSCLCVCVCYVNIYVCMYLYVYVYLCVCMYVYTYTHTNNYMK